LLSHSAWAINIVIARICSDGFIMFSKDGDRTP
jgi:hypothetical protein